MPKQMNLAGKIEKSLPGELVALVNEAIAIAGNRKQPLYLVGGVVRDLLLGQISDAYDLDLVVEGDAVGWPANLPKKWAAN